MNKEYYIDLYKFLSLLYVYYALAYLILIIDLHLLKSIQINHIGQKEDTIPVPLSKGGIGKTGMKKKRKI